MSAAHTALVIGGGIAGPVAATALTMAGIDTAVYEARPADPSAANGIGGSLALEPNGLAALRIIDADDDVRAAAIPIARSFMSIASKPGREVPGPQGLPPRQLIDRGVLHGILGERAQRAGVRIQHGKKLIGERVRRTSGGDARVRTVCRSTSCRPRPCGRTRTSTPGSAP
jgi:2-polyprenyl-6-methoxyphenol hydroxylase-like FAD-dependent oxidoreductase